VSAIPTPRREAESSGREKRASSFSRRAASCACMISREMSTQRSFRLARTSVRARVCRFRNDTRITRERCAGLISRMIRVKIATSDYGPAFYLRGHLRYGRG